MTCEQAVEEPCQLHVDGKSVEKATQKLKDTAHARGHPEP